MCLFLQSCHPDGDLDRSYVDGWLQSCHPDGILYRFPLGGCYNRVTPTGFWLTHCAVGYNRVTPTGFWNVAFGPWGYKCVTPMGFGLVFQWVVVTIVPPRWGCLPGIVPLVTIVPPPLDFHLGTPFSRWFLKASIYQMN
jgi:hypothetical protein